ncbi:hypothetical protein [Halodesulfovibrio sp.]|uniref:hypothetical protein n=1 Tax=Halodesulfovibrio sp. TaxID=1912772 RepID=UPI0025BC9779|nr:hypothetical protein [Halodesulfovibrio sp.]
MYDYTPGFEDWVERMDSFMQTGRSIKIDIEELEVELSIVKDDQYGVKLNGWLVNTTSDPSDLLKSVIIAYEEAIIEEELEVAKEDAVELAKDDAKTKAIEADKKPEEVAMAILQAAMKAEMGIYGVDGEEVAALVAEGIEELLFACEESY